jgi:hypothetical protein
MQTLTLPQDEVLELFSIVQNAQSLAQAIKWMIEHNQSIDWGEDIPYQVAELLDIHRNDILPAKSK